MVELKSVEEMQNAIAKAKEVKPLVQLTSIYRQYVVTNRQKGSRYFVNFFVEGGKRYGGCQCKAGQNHKLCYHIAAAAGVHVAIASAR
jgi:hypothetical protein